MQILQLNQNSEEWFEARKGKITGSKLKDVMPKTRGKGRKIGFYQLIADRIAQTPDEEDVRDRGHRLEEEAIKMFEEQQGVKVERDGLVVADFNKNIALSPDGLIKSKGKYTEAVEVKCLNSARHIEVIIEQEIPTEYEYQAMQYFIVNDDLQVLHFVFYDPRIPAKPYVKITIQRDYFADKTLDDVKQIEIDTLKEVDDWVERLTF